MIASKAKSAAEPCIQVEHVSFSFGELPVLADISFEIWRGDYVGIIGPNGGGKTTLLKILLGLLQPTSGSIQLFGQPATSFDERHYLGYVPQRVAQADFPATVREVVASGRSARCTAGHMHAGHAAQDIAAALELADISDLAGRRLGELSGGQRQRVFIARALAGRPRILLLDEPTTGIDAASQQQFFDLLRRLNREHGLTILFVSHDLGAMRHEASRIFELNQTLAEHADPATLALNSHAH